MFPDAFRGITKAAEELQKEKWTHEAIERYFLINHNKHVWQSEKKGIPRSILTLCEIKTATVNELSKEICKLTFNNGIQVNALNSLQLPIQIGSLVAIHYRIIVDVLDIPRLSGSYLGR